MYITSLYYIHYIYILGPESYDRDLRCGRVLLTTTISQPGFVTMISLRCDVVTIVTHKPLAGAPVMPTRAWRFAFRVNTLQAGVGYRGGSSGCGERVRAVVGKGWDPSVVTPCCAGAGAD